MTALHRLAAPLLLNLVTCSFPALQAGQNVVLYQARFPDHCRELGQVVGHAYGSIVYGDSIERDAINDLLNEAAGLGATHVRLLSTDPSAHACRALGLAFKCLPPPPPAPPAPPPPPTAMPPAVAPPPPVVPAPLPADPNAASNPNAPEPMAPPPPAPLPPLPVGAGPAPSSLPSVDIPSSPGTQSQPTHPPSP